MWWAEFANSKARIQQEVHLEILLMVITIPDAHVNICSNLLILWKTLQHHVFGGAVENRNHFRGGIGHIDGKDRMLHTQMAVADHQRLTVVFTHSSDAFDVHTHAYKTNGDALVDEVTHPAC